MFDQSTLTAADSSRLVKDALSRIWSDLLDLEYNGELPSELNFFKEGGDSLTAMTMALEVSEATRLEIELSLVLSKPTFGAFSDAVVEMLDASKRPTHAPESQATDLSVKHFPALGGQHEILTRYMLHPQMNSGAHIIHLCLDTTAAKEDAIQLVHELARRHDGLSLRFTKLGTRIVSYVAPPDPWDVIISASFSSAGDQEPEATLSSDFREYTRRMLAKPFDRPLFFVAIGPGDGGGAELVLCLHHILADKISVEVLRRTLSELVGTIRSGDLGVTNQPTYPSFAAFLGEYSTRLGSCELDESQAYWRKVATTSQEAILQIRKSARAISESRGKVHKLRTIPRLDVRRLADHHKCLPVTIFVSQFCSALSSTPSNVERPSFIGLALTTRNHIKYTDCVGYFNQLIPFPTSHSAAAGPSLNTELARTIEHSWIGPQLIRDAFELGDLDPFTHPIFTHVVNYSDVQRVQATSRPLPTGVPEVIHSNDDTLHRLVLHVEGDETGFQLRLKFNEACVTHSMVAEIGAEIDRSITSMINLIPTDDITSTAEEDPSFRSHGD